MTINKKQANELIGKKAYYQGKKYTIGQVEASGFVHLIPENRPAPLGASPAGEPSARAFDPAKIIRVALELVDIVKDVQEFYQENKGWFSALWARITSIFKKKR